MSREENFLFKDHNEPLLAEEVGPNLYRLLECPVFTEEVHYGDMVEVEPQADGSLSFRGVAEPTRYRTWTWILSSDVTNSADIVELCELVQSRGGHWQRDFGGLLQLALPVHDDLEPDAWYDERKASRENTAIDERGLLTADVDNTLLT